MDDELLPLKMKLERNWEHLKTIEEDFAKKSMVIRRLREDVDKTIERHFNLLVKNTDQKMSALTELRDKLHQSHFSQLVKRSKLMSWANLNDLLDLISNMNKKKPFAYVG